LITPQLSAGPLGNLRERKVGKAFLCSNVLNSAFFIFVSMSICLLRKYSAFTSFGFMGYGKKRIIAFGFSATVKFSVYRLPNQALKLTE